MDRKLREYFDELLERVLEGLPPKLRELLNEVPLIVEDYPSAEIRETFGLQYRDELCGLHDGIALTERSIESHSNDVPDHIMIYREGILSLAADEAGDIDDDELLKQIRITVLHEIGHHFGLDEDDLEKLGYG